MAAVNYYAGLARGSLDNTATTVGSSSAGTSVDVEVRMQINNGTNATGLTKKDVVILLKKIIRYIEAGGPLSGTYVPPL